MATLHKSTTYKINRTIINKFRCQCWVKSLGL